MRRASCYGEMTLCCAWCWAAGIFVPRSQLNCLDIFSVVRYLVEYYVLWANGQAVETREARGVYHARAAAPGSCGGPEPVDVHAQHGLCHNPFFYNSNLH